MTWCERYTALVDGHDLDNLILSLAPGPDHLLPLDLVRRAVDQLEFDDWRSGRSRRAAQSYATRSLEHRLGDRQQRPKTQSAHLTEDHLRALNEITAAVAELWKSVSKLKGAENGQGHYWLAVSRDDLLRLRGLSAEPLQTDRLRRSSLAAA